MSKEYFLTRMSQIFLTDPAAYSFAHNGKKIQVFQNKDGDIKINYPSLFGGAETYKDGKQDIEFFRIRVNPAKEKDYKYYRDEKAGNHVFFPLQIIQKFTEKQEIETLYLVDGEFKAYAATEAGFDVISVYSQDIFNEPEATLHPDIVRLIHTCNVKNIVLLLGADTLHLDWEPETDPEKDLSMRLFAFAKSVKNFKAQAIQHVKGVYFMHINPEYLSEGAKGIDDLLSIRTGEADYISNDLDRLHVAKNYFSGINLTAESHSRINSFFYLNKYQNKPGAFASKFAHIVKDYPFYFQGVQYVVDAVDGLKILKHRDNDLFVRVGCKYYKNIEVPNAHKKGVFDKKMIEWSTVELKRDYVDKGFKNFFDEIPKYDDFCNIPDNTAGFEPVVGNCLNLYFQLDHEVTPGSWETIERYLKHVFGDKILESGYTNYDLALDYFTLLYTVPTQALPIMCLVNREKNTGKSTMLWLMKEIFKENCTFIGNEELKDHLNDDWAARLVIGVDEGFIDKKTVIERLKSMSTSKFIKLRGMYKGRSEIGFFGKFVITSNDEDNFISIDKDETRFWVNKVPIITNDDPLLVEKMAKEIPAFLAYLTDREILHPRVSRHWFKHTLLHNEALTKLKESSRGWLEKELIIAMTDRFFTHEYHTLYYTISELVDILNSNNAAVKFRKADITAQLKDKFGLESVNGRFQHPNKPGDGYQSKTSEKKGRCYEFRIEDFVSPAKLDKEFAEYYTREQIAEFREHGSPEVYLEPVKQDPFAVQAQLDIPADYSHLNANSEERRVF